MATTVPMTLPLPLQAAAGDVHVLHPGDVVCAERGARFETLLGSCIAIVLTDPRRTVGAMCHIVHSSPVPQGRTGNAAYADEALHAMYRQLHTRGIVPRLCEAYVYGGANMFPNLVTESHVGERNARWALQALAYDGVRLLAHDVGGQRYRKLSWVVGPQAPQLTMAGD